MSIQLTLLSDFDNSVQKRNRTAVHSNSFTTSKRSFSVADNKIMYVILWQLTEFDKKYDIDFNNDLTMTFDGRLLHDVDTNTTRAVNRLKNFRDKSVITFDKKKKKYTVVGFINYAVYDTTTHEVEIQISKKALPLFFSLSEYFTKLPISTALECNSVFSQRLFEYCAMYANAGFFSFELDYYRYILDIGQKYTKKNLMQRVIKDPQVELRQLFEDERSDLFFSFFEKSDEITFLVHQRHEPKRKNVHLAELIIVQLSKIMNFSQPQIEQILADYSINNPDLKELYFEISSVLMHTKSKVALRGKIMQILLAYGLYNVKNTDK